MYIGLILEEGLIKIFSYSQIHKKKPQQSQNYDQYCLHGRRWWLYFYFHRIIVVKIPISKINEINDDFQSRYSLPNGIKIIEKKTFGSVCEDINQH